MIIEIGVILREPYGNNHSSFAAQEEEQYPKGLSMSFPKTKYLEGCVHYSIYFAADYKIDLECLQLSIDTSFGIDHSEGVYQLLYCPR